MSMEGVEAVVLVVLVALREGADVVLLRDALYWTTTTPSAATGIGVVAKVSLRRLLLLGMGDVC